MADIPNKDKAAILLCSIAPDAAEGVLELLGEKMAVELRDLMVYYADAPDIDELIAGIRAEFDAAAGGEIDLAVAFLTGAIGTAAGSVGGAAGRGFGSSAVGTLPGGISSLRGGTAVSDRMAAYQFAVSEMEEGPDGGSLVRDDLEVGDDPTKALQALDAEALAAGLRKEHASAVAIVLNNLKPKKASEVLGRLTPETRQEVFVHMANGVPDSAELNRAIIRSVVEQCISTSPDTMTLSREEQFRLLAEVLQSVDQRERVTMLSALEERNHEKAEKLDEFLFEFDDILRIDDRSLQGLLSHASIKSLATALSGAPDELVQRVKDNISERNKQMLEEEMEFQGAVSANKVETTRAEITELIRQSEREGTLRWLAR